MKKNAANSKSKASETHATASQPGETKLYTLLVNLISGPVTDKFAEQNPEVSRTIQMCGNQTLADLHFAIFDAFNRDEEHMYEFQFGKRPMARDALSYVMAYAYDSFDEKTAGVVDDTTLDALNLKKRSCFYYWFDFGDDWWHQIKVEGVEDQVPSGKYPRVVKKIGKSPKQYP